MKVTIQKLKLYKVKITAKVGGNWDHTVRIGLWRLFLTYNLNCASIHIALTEAQD